MIGLAIQNRMSVNSFLSMQIGTHPCLTASPAAYPLVNAADFLRLHIGQNNKDIKWLAGEAGYPN